MMRATTSSTRSKLLTALFLSAIILINGDSTAWAAAGPKAQPVPVYAEKAQLAHWQPHIFATGTLVAQQGITVKAETAGRITHIFFKSGQYIQKGQPLIQIYPDILQAKLESDKAALRLSTLTLKRYRKLYKTNAVSQSDFDSAQVTFSKDKAAVDQVKAQLDQTLIESPFSGYLGIRQVSLGDYITPGQAIVNLQNTNPIYVDFSVPEVDLTKVKIGARVTILAAAYGQKKFTGDVIAVESLINPQTRTLKVRAALPNPDRKLIPGSFVEVNLYVDKPQQVVMVPQTAIVYSQQGDYVYRIIGNKAVKTNVTLGMRDNKSIIILKGLKASDRIVTAGTQKLFNGKTISITKN